MSHAAVDRESGLSRTSERTWVLTVSGTHALIHATELTFAGLLLRIEDDFGSDLLVLGILANVGAFAFGVGALPAGFLVDKLGTVPILRLSLGTTAFTAALTAIGNVGPGLGAIGPADNFAHLPPYVKLVLSFCMIAGRLEIFTVLVLFEPHFWKR